MNIYDYIDEYGIYSFNEKVFNEVDAVIFSFLSYVDFSNILDHGKHTIKEIGRMHLGLHHRNEDNIIAVTDATKILTYLKDSKRYKDCIVFNHEYVGNKKVQFGAISIEYLPGKVFVSFEGTDELFSGWIEDFMLSYEFPTASHKLAINYLNKHYTFSLKELIIGGHSKGGNLALVAGMYANAFVRAKIKTIYNCDGPGLLEKEFNSSKYQRILPKYIHIIPEYSVVGIILNHSKDSVIKSSVKGLLAHDIIYWQINRNKFERANLSNQSIEMDNDIQKWLAKYNKQDKRVFADNLNYILYRSDIQSLLDLKNEKKKILDLIKESKEMDASTKKMITDLIAILLKSVKTTREIEVKNFISKNINIVKKTFKKN